MATIMENTSDEATDNDDAILARRTSQDFSLFRVDGDHKRDSESLHGDIGKLVETLGRAGDMLTRATDKLWQRFLPGEDESFFFCDDDFSRSTFAASSTVASYSDAEDDTSISTETSSQSISEKEVKDSSSVVQPTTKDVEKYERESISKTLKERDERIISQAKEIERLRKTLEEANIKDAVPEKTTNDDITFLLMDWKDQIQSQSIEIQRLRESIKSQAIGYISKSMTNLSSDGMMTRDNKGSSHEDDETVDAHHDSIPGNIPEDCKEENSIAATRSQSIDTGGVGAREHHESQNALPPIRAIRLPLSPSRTHRRPRPSKITKSNTTQGKPLTGDQPIGKAGSDRDIPPKQRIKRQRSEVTPIKLRRSNSENRLSNIIRHKPFNKSKTLKNVVIVDISGRDQTDDSNGVTGLELVLLNSPQKKRHPLKALSRRLSMQHEKHRKRGMAKKYKQNNEPSLVDLIEIDDCPDDGTINSVELMLPHTTAADNGCIGASLTSVSNPGLLEHGEISTASPSSSFLSAEVSPETRPRSPLDYILEYYGASSMLPSSQLEEDKDYPTSSRSALEPTKASPEDRPSTPLDFLFDYYDVSALSTGDQLKPGRESPASRSSPLEPTEASPIATRSSHEPAEASPMSPRSPLDYLYEFDQAFFNPTLSPKRPPHIPSRIALKRDGTSPMSPHSPHDYDEAPYDEARSGSPHSPLKQYQRPPISPTSNEFNEAYHMASEEENWESWDDSISVLTGYKSEASWYTTESDAYFDPPSVKISVTSNTSSARDCVV